MAKRRYAIGRFSTYEEAARFKDNELSMRHAFDPNDETEIQIRKMANGFNVVRRVEVK
jgi:hypothetical protein